MGSPPMNLVPAVYSVENGTGTVTFGDGATGARLPVTDEAVQAAYASGGGAGSNIVVGIRPEAFVPATGNGALTVTATSVENAGSDTFVAFDLGGRQVTARLPGRMHVLAGDRVPLDVDLSTVCYFDPRTEQRID
jgi:multiple sugar transport system ATP-binding protein